MAPQRQRGIALIIVLWTLTLLTVIAANFGFAMRTETLAVRNAWAAAQAEAMADGAVHRALYALFQQAGEAEAWQADGSERQWEIDGARIRVVMMDVSGKIDINTSSDALLKGLLLSAGVDEAKAVQLLDAILDWRDVDTLPRAHGAEGEAYRAAGLKYQPANAPFAAVEQLQQVLGMTPDIYSRLAPLITVLSKQSGINPLVAQRGVLLAIPDLNAAQVDAYLEQRQLFLANRQTPPLLPAAAAYTSAPVNTLIDVRAEASLTEGAVFVREAVVSRGGDAQSPIAFLSWKEGRPAPAAEAR